MTDADEKTTMTKTDSADDKGDKITWLWPSLAGGLLLALLLLALLLFIVRPMIAKQAVSLPFQPVALQSENLQALEDEIAALKNSLILEPCTMPPLPGVPEESLRLPNKPGEPEAANGASPRPPEAASLGLVERVERATVMVLVESAEGVGNGSGFFVAPNVIVTNRHVVDALVGPADRVFITNKALGGLVPATVLRVSGSDEARDYAILNASPPSGSQYSVLELSPHFNKTDRVSAWGYPILLTKTDSQLTALMEGDEKAVPDLVYSEGVISVVQDFHGLSIINHTAEVSPGNSGGPLVNESGQVVGINTMIRVDEDSNRQVNIALGSNDLIHFSSDFLVKNGE